MEVGFNSESPKPPYQPIDVRGDASDGGRVIWGKDCHLHCCSKVASIGS
jgi:hypothetical protein